MVTLRAITGGPMATPTVLIGEEHVVGFDPDWMRQRLGLETSPVEGSK